MTKKHVVALVLVLLMGIFVGSQCAMAASEQVEIRLMHFFTEGGARHGVMQHVLKEFAKNKGSQHFSGHSLSGLIVE